MTRRLAFLTLLLALLPSSVAASPSVDLQARPALGPRLGFRDPVAVSVTLTNRGTGSRIRVQARAEVDPDPGSRGEATVDLPPGSRKRLTLLIPPFYGGNTLEVTAWEGRRQVARRRLPIDVQYSQPKLTVVLSPEPGAFAYLASYNWSGPPTDKELAVNQVAPEDFPQEAAALAGLDVLVLHDLPRLHLSGPAQEAIADWVRNGGRLLLFASPDPGEFHGSPLESLLPLRPSGTATVEGLPVLEGTPDRAQVLLSRGGRPLLLAGPRVAGVVALVTTPLPSTDLLGSQQTQDLFRRFAAHCDAAQSSFPDVGEDIKLLGAPPELKPPDLALVAWFLLGYVVLVGPVNWMVLRRRDRMLRIFLTVPLLAGGFALLAFMGGWMVRGDEVLLLEAGQLGLRSGEAGARWQGLTGLYSPRSAVYTLSFPLSTRLSEDQGTTWDRWPGLVLALDERLELRELQMRMWSLRRFRGQRPLLLRGPVEVAVLAREVVVANGSELDLRECRAVAGGLCSEPFDLPAGTRRAVPMARPVDLASLVPAPPEDVRFETETRNLVERAQAQLAGSPKVPWLLGWTGRPLSGVESSERTAQVSTLNLVLVQGEARP